MTQTSNRIFDEMARLMNDAAGVAQGVRREFDTLFRNQAERILRDLDVVQREDFEAVREMARLAREENEALKVRVAALEAKLEKPKKSSGSATAQYFMPIQAFLALCEAPRYKPCAKAAPRHPWRLAAFNGRPKMPPFPRVR